MECSFRDIAYTIRNAKKRYGATLLIGSGCSYTAGIDTSSRIIERIKKDFPEKAKRAESEHYSSYMKVLEKDERDALITEYIENADLNWAHIGIAQLIKEGYVTRVLTTNFDPLVIRACALVNKYPAVYDIPSISSFDLKKIANLSVHYLYGQHTGIALVHPDADDEPIRGIFDSLIEDSINERPIIVVGYRGVSDPVFKSLCKIKEFGRGLYWICNQHVLPPPDAISELFNKDKCAYYCLNYDADSFFIKLSRELGIFPPQIMKKPFSHLLEIFESITDFPIENENTQISLTSYYKEIVNNADKKYGDLEQIEESNDPNVIAMKMAYLFASESYEDIVSLDPKIIEKLKDNQKDYLIWSYIHLGDKLADQAGNEKDEEKKQLYRESYEKYAKAVEIRPDYPSAYCSWGNALSEQAESKEGEEADRLYREACDKHKKVVENKPDMYPFYYNWGVALLNQSRRKKGDEAIRLLQEAFEKLMKAKEEGFYRLACIESLRGNLAECQKWLLKDKEAGTLPSKINLMMDEDLDNVRDQDWFKEFMASLQS